MLEMPIDNKRIYGFIRKNDGAIVKYDTETHAIAIGNSDGTIRTMFQPDKGIDYYLYLRNSNNE